MYKGCQIPLYCNMQTCVFKNPEGSFIKRKHKSKQQDLDVPPKGLPP